MPLKDGRPQCEECESREIECTIAAAGKVYFYCEFHAPPERGD